MKMMYIVLFGLVITAGLIYYLTTRTKSEMSDNQAKQENPYLGLREQIFKVTPEQTGLANSDEEKVYAVIMDVSLGQDGTITLVSIIDGNASIYLSSGGGVIGGIAHESVRRAARDFVNDGEKYISKMTPIDSFPLPKLNNARFYVLTNKGKYSIEEQTDKIENGKSNWEPFFYSGNKVITELRLTTESK